MPPRPDSDNFRWISLPCLAFVHFSRKPPACVHLPECVTWFCDRACGTTYHVLDQPLVLLGIETVTLKHQDLLEQSKPNEDLVRNNTKR